MLKQEFIDIFKTLSVQNVVEMSSDASCECYYELCNCLSEANKIHNLTAIKDEKGIMLKHFIDSLLISPLIEKGSKVIDIGCGP